MSAHKQAVIDAGHRSFVNHEIFYFSGTEEKVRFDSDPPAYCGILSDPVSRQRFRPARSSGRIDHAGRTFFFVSDSTFALFRAMPDSFATPRFGMRPMADKGE